MEPFSMSTPETRLKPNILITGSPGTGKSTLGQQVAERLEFEFIEIGKEARENNLYGEFDEAYNCHTLDEDALLDHLSERMDSDDGGIVVDYHGCDLFPERWFDVVIVLRCATEGLYDRLTARGYNERKVRENIECEIFGTLLEEAKESYKEEIVHEMQSNTIEEMEENLENICELARAFKNGEHMEEQ